MKWSAAGIARVSVRAAACRPRATLALLLAPACVPQPLEVTFAPGAPAPPEPPDPRLERAVRETSGLVGHGVTLRFRLDEMPRSSFFLDSLIESEVGRVPKDLRRLKERDPDAFAWGAPSLVRIEFGYDGTERYAEVRFDRGAGTLLVVLGASSRVPDDVVSRPFREGFTADLRARFCGVEAERVPAGERRRWIEVVSDLCDEGDATTLRVLRLDAAASGETRGAARAWLVERLARHGAYDTPAPGALGAWLAAKMDALPPHLRFGAARAVAGKPEHFAGFDFLEFGFRVLDEWARAGAPAAFDFTTARDDETGRDEPRDPRQALFELLLHPARRRDDGAWEDPAAGVWDARFWPAALRTNDAKHRVAGLVAARRDARVTETVFVNAAYLAHMERDRLADVTYLLRAIEADEAQWSAATRVVAERMDPFWAKDLRDEAERLWRAHPARRGVVLYLVALGGLMDPYGQGLARAGWGEFAKAFGGAVARDDFSAFLDQGPRALAMAPRVWPALARGFPRVDLLAPRFDRALDAARGESQRVIDVIGAIAAALREDGDAGEIRRLGQWARRRAAAHAEEEPLLRGLK